MNGIIGMTSLTLETELTRQQRENLVIVSHLAHSLLIIIDDILDITKSKFSFYLHLSRYHPSVTRVMTDYVCLFRI